MATKQKHESWAYVLGLTVAVTLLLLGAARLSLGINTISITDAYSAHYMNVGLMYMEISSMISIALAIVMIAKLKGCCKV